MIGALSPGPAGDAPQGRQLLGALADHDRLPEGLVLVLDRACEGDEARDLAERLGFRVVVPPRANRREPWDYDREPCKRCHEVERRFRRPGASGASTPATTSGTAWTGVSSSLR